MAKKKQELSPEAAEQAERMKERLEQLEAQRPSATRRMRAARRRRRLAAGSVSGKQIRSGRRGNR